MRRVGCSICAALLAAVFALPGTALAADATPTPDGFPKGPDDYEVTSEEALEAADRDPKVVDRKRELARGDELTAAIQAEAVTVWEVGYFLDDEKVNLVIIDAKTGEVKESWTGDAVSWPMARGREGQFGHLLNAPWVWGPLASVFLLGLVDFRRWRKWAHLDLLVLLSFGVSQAFFNAAEIGVSVPLYYPPLLYLLARMLWIGFRGAGRAGTASEGLQPSAPVWLLATLAVGLIALRIAANVADSGVIDVGYAGVIGADKITDSQPIYGEESFPDDNPTGDTYGPANYFAYVPFEEALPWSGAWDDLPAAHAAAIFFDLVTVVGLFALGRALTRRREDDDPDDGAGATASAAASAGYPRDSAGYPEGAEERGGAGTAGTDEPGGTSEYQAAGLPARLVRLRGRAGRGITANPIGVTLAFAWVACPWTAFTLQSNSNDALLSALLVWSLVAFASPLARGGLLAIASLAKFAPLALVPLYAAGERGIRFRTPEARHAVLRPLALFTAAFVAGAVLLIAHPVVDPGLADFYDRTIATQVERVSPFSIWGQIDAEWLHTLVKLGAVALGVLVAFVPKRRSPVQIAALAAAVIIAIELTVEHWFYLYIPWFLPMVLAAIVLVGPAIRAAPHRPLGGRSAAGP